MDQNAQCGECGCNDSSIFVRRRNVCSECGERHGIGNGRLRGAVAGANGSVAAMMHSGQPLIDPAMRADWIAQQRAAQLSWHAGYYHTEWGTPVALMVAPTVRTHTRWSWGVAQTNVMPLYHQFERPYPGPVMGAEYGGPASPLLPTPRWPSHTDQFGVYLSAVRGSPLHYPETTRAQAGIGLCFFRRQEPGNRGNRRMSKGELGGESKRSVGGGQWAVVSGQWAVGTLIFADHSSGCGCDPC
jgi:hypothetical protein